MMTEFAEDGELQARTRGGGPIRRIDRWAWEPSRSWALSGARGPREREGASDLAPGSGGRLGRGSGGSETPLQPKTPGKAPPVHPPSLGGWGRAALLALWAVTKARVKPPPPGRSGPGFVRQDRPSRGKGHRSSPPAVVLLQVSPVSISHAAPRVGSPRFSLAPSAGLTVRSSACKQAGRPASRWAKLACRS